MKISIECATPKDYPKFEELQKRFQYLGTSELRSESSVTKETFDDYVDRESMLVAYQEDELVGYAFLDAYLDDNDDVVCSIREIFVDPNHQRKGYGKAIVQRVREEAKQVDAKYLQVFSVFVETDRFWMITCGFEVDKETGYLVQKIN